MSGAGAGVFSVSGRRATVVGAARSGIAAAELLARRGARVTLSDAQAALAGEDQARLSAAGVALELGGHLAGTFDGADLIVMSPGVPPELEVVAHAKAGGVPVIGEVELAFRWLKGRVIAITGTKGKSTTTSLTGRMLERAGFTVAIGGNIGAPVSAQVDASTADTLHVIEMSSFQLEQIEQFRPWVAVMLNFSPDHLDRHHTVEAYAGAKRRVFENQQPTDVAVVNADDEPAMQLAASTRATRRLFSRRGAIGDGTVIDEGWIVARWGGRTERLVPLSAIRLLGTHLVDDVMAAATVASIAGAGSAAMTGAVETFGGLEHAMELVAEVEGVRFVNDSKATNVDAAVRSIESFQSGVVAIVGGKFKGGDLRLLRSPIGGRGKAVVAIGEAKALVRQALEDVVEVREADSMEEAVASAFALAMPSGVVLLAPACASFDMFRDYADRGRRFKDAVQRLVESRG
ncbi:MAG TPA: UDP-N-acetylmuramoyl-L-alanine--D-glutamate ligase [Vicinamibacterales bacterium]|nr:UDP-N-acetylmuramoyl-L-alanine--D-glutamate ligase [Vicinamibacterales bacterium]